MEPEPNSDSAPESAGHLRHMSSSGTSTSSATSLFSSDSGEIIPLQTAATAEEEAGGGEATPKRERCIGRAMTWGSASMVGRRKEMEDAVAVAPLEFMAAVPCVGVGGCAAAAADTTVEISHVRLFGVYDGHGGSQVANFCAERVHEVVANKWEELDGGEGWQRRWEVAFCDGFEKVDEEVVTEAVAPDIVGSTAVVVVVSGCQIIASNCGDSRAVLCRRNQTIQLTLDQKGSSPPSTLLICINN